MLKIETLSAEKEKMEATLLREEQQWIQNDTIFKQRRIILNYIIKVNLELSLDSFIARSLERMEFQLHHESSRTFEIIFFMIQHIFQKNRLPSINFMAETIQYMNSQQEEMSELRKTQNELTTRISAIEEEKRDMRKKIDEMRVLCDLKEKKDKLQIDISSQEIRVAQLRKQYGK